MAHCKKGTREGFFFFGKTRLDGKKVVEVYIGGMEAE